MADRNRKLRVKHGGQVLVKEGQTGNQIGFVQNVSESGMLLSSSHRFTKGTELMIYIPLRIGFRRSLCMISGKVLRKQPLQGSEVFGYGVQFAPDTSNSTFKMLAKYVEYKKTGKVPEKTDPYAKRLSPYHD